MQTWYLSFLPTWTFQGRKMEYAVLRPIGARRCTPFGQPLSLFDQQYLCCIDLSENVNFGRRS